MTLGEFKAWLDGFSAAINGAPTVEQWATIREKLSEVQAVSIPAAPRPYSPNPYALSTLPTPSVKEWYTTCGAAGSLGATDAKVWS